MNSYGNCVPKLHATIRKQRQKKNKETSRKNQKKQINVHGKMKHNKQKKLQEVEIIKLAHNHRNQKVQKGLHKKQL